MVITRGSSFLKSSSAEGRPRLAVQGSRHPMGPQEAPEPRNSAGGRAHQAAGYPGAREHLHQIHVSAPGAHGFHGPNGQLSEL